MSVDVTLSANITVVCGASGSGKSAWTKQQIAKFKRVCVYDADGEYSEIKGYVKVENIVKLCELLRRAHSGHFAFVPRRNGNSEEFDRWAQAVFAWGNCAAVAEELADVTSPGKAPPGWGTLVRRGRKRGISIFGVTQRPAESDKTIIGNASLLHVGNLNRHEDRVYMAKELDVPVQYIVELMPLQYMERNRNTRELRAGTVTF